ncbi:tRNA (adenosine(37)-N6)-threonylcarbamoyltransferase complex dimerization subunit type 1 TsaB [Saccharibacillus qingshengii]|uniref:tRNA (adenosine(37)-N6)-threonylcarbamoyltransferase complex dimerization subunit type 1 TsaB n=1 Tax=Saccharibacillus qingshengii TaxID=1763540 RepID=UPI001551CBA8|nr:tRNA (adenosine(37)-N6)-threonylcarbamoyltransferase complex dimerization subunit type 1 TsaB [Saccharibacillus qingshengii]
MTKNNAQPGRILALDTSSASQAVAVLEGSGILFESSSLAERNHSVNLLPEIERALRQSGTDKQALAGIAVGIGPGSYTGVRIAVTTAKTLAWALKLPVAAVSSLEAQAASGLEASGLQGKIWVVPLVDARRGQAYTALFEADLPSGRGRADELPLNRTAEDAILQVQDWMVQLAARLQELPADKRPDCILFTGETEKHAETVQGLAEMAGLPEDRIALQDCAAEARWIGRIGLRKLESGDTVDAHDLLPNYTQVTEAEANLLRAKS